MAAMEKFALTLVLLITDVLSLLLFRGHLGEEGYAIDNDGGYSDNNSYYHHHHHHHFQYNSVDIEQTGFSFSCSKPIVTAQNILLLMLSDSQRRLSVKKTNANGGSWTNRASLLGFVDAKGVAGIGGKGGVGDGTQGPDKGGQQVPQEVYNALSYAGSAFLLTLSAPLVLYGLNKVLNKVEECFGCGPSSKKARQNDSSGNNINGNNSKLNNQKALRSAEFIEAPFTISHSQHQLLQNQQQFYNQQQPNLHQSKSHHKQLHHQLQHHSPETISGSHESVAHHHNNNHHHHRPYHPYHNNGQRQQQSSSSSPQITPAQLTVGALATSAPTATTMPSSTAMTIPFDSELNYKGPTMARHFHHPYIISSPHI